MAFLEAPGISEGLQVLLLAMALIVAALILIRYVSFYARLRKVRKENMELASGLKKRLKAAKLGSLDELVDEEDDKMFRKPARAKPLVIPAAYEARVSRTRGKALKRTRRRRKARPKARKLRKAKR